MFYQDPLQQHAIGGEQNSSYVWSKKTAVQCVCVKYAHLQIKKCKNVNAGLQIIVDKLRFEGIETMLNKIANDWENIWKPIKIFDNLDKTLEHIKHLKMIPGNWWERLRKWEAPVHLQVCFKRNPATQG